MRGMGRPDGMKNITSRANPVYRGLRRLSASARERRDRGVCLLEGERLVRAGIEALGGVQTLVLTPEHAESAGTRSLIDRSGAGEVVLLDGKLFKELSSLSAPAGVMAVARIPAGPAGLPGGDLILVDGVQDPGNLGMILRSAAAAGARGVVLSPDCADPWSPKVLRAGMSAHFHLAILQGRSLPDESERFPGEVLVLHHRGGKSLFEADLTVSPLALVVGAEGRGVSQEMLRKGDCLISIPMPGWDEPLNAAAAATICLFEMVRQRGIAARRR